MIRVENDEVQIDSTDIVKELFMLFKTMQKHGFDLPTFIELYNTGQLDKKYIVNQVDDKVIRAIFYKNTMTFLGGNRNE